MASVGDTPSDDSSPHSGGRWLGSLSLSPPVWFRVSSLPHSLTDVFFIVVASSLFAFTDSSLLGEEQKLSVVQILDTSGLPLGRWSAFICYTWIDIV